MDIGLVNGISVVPTSHSLSVRSRLDHSFHVFQPAEGASGTTPLDTSNERR